MGAVSARRAGQGKVHFYDTTDSPRITGFQVESCLDATFSHADTFGVLFKMMSIDPLKSAISIMTVDDTSLALPSVNQYGSGQQRVLEQVQTIRRSKSRHSSNRSGSTSLSPTSKTSRS